MTIRDEHENPGGMRPFSPLFDHITRDVGMIAAGVYGAVWRHSQLRDGVCRASMRVLARKLGCHMSTIQRHLRTLVRAGYLEDMTPASAIVLTATGLPRRIQ